MTNPPVATREYLAPPVTEVGVIGWLRGNLFNSWFNSLLTIAVLLLLWQLVPPFFSWAFREPPRGRFDKGFGDHRPPRLGVLLRALGSKPSFWLISLGASFSSMMGYGVFFWLPSFLVRSYGLTLLDASLFYGAVLLIGGLAGALLFALVYPALEPALIARANFGEVTLESLLGIKRAGANAILTYYAKDAARWLAETG